MKTTSSHKAFPLKSPDTLGWIGLGMMVFLMTVPGFSQEKGGVQPTIKNAEIDSITEQKLVEEKMKFEARFHHLSPEELLDFKNQQKIEEASLRTQNYVPMATNQSFCDELEAFCADEDMEFDNVTGGIQAPNGPDYGDCLFSYPNPVWYFLSIAESGNIQITINQQNLNGIGTDVDFAMWGPFDNLEEGCNEVMGGIAPIQFSYSTSSTETIGLGVQGGANFLGCDGTSTPSTPQAGEYYIVMIINWDGSAGTISLEQTNLSNSNAGSTDCSLVCQFEEEIELNIQDESEECGEINTWISANIEHDEAIVYYQGTNSNGTSMAEPVDEDGIQITEPGTYYFRAHYIAESDETDNTMNCWSAAVSYTINPLIDIEPDAGEDQTIFCQGAVQIGFEPASPIPDDYCTPEGTNSGRYINKFTTTGGINNINNVNSQFSNGGYGDFTNMILKANPGDNISFSTDIQGGIAGFRMWVDWDRDGNFDNSDVVWNSSSYQNSHSNSFTIPTDASGLYRMRIVSHWLSTTGDVSACETGFTYGEFEDYLVQVGSAYDESVTYSWDPEEGLNDPTIPNPIASPTETTEYELTISYGGCEFTDTVTVTVYPCLPPLPICVGDTVNLEDGLLSDMDSEDEIWYEDENGEPSSTIISNSEEIDYGTYWAFYDNQYWRLIVLPDFTPECVECPEIIGVISKNQTTGSEEFNPIEAEYGFLDFYKIDQGFKIRYNGANINGNWFYFKPNTGANIRFLDGSMWGEGDLDVIAVLEGSTNKPLMRIVFGPGGIEGFYGSRVSADDPNYTLEPIELIGLDMNPNIVWYPQNDLTIKVERFGSGSLIYDFKSINLREDCPETPNEAFINPQIMNKGGNE